MTAPAHNPIGLRTTSPLVRACAALLCLFVASDLLAQVTVIRSRVVAVNGRTVQEIRAGNEPGSNTLLRAVVVTNGPTGGTTTLVTAVADVNDWVNGAAPAPVFASVIESGTVFSVGGGCRRGNQLDFPFINANRPRILRIVNGTPTVVTPGISGNELFDSAECVVSGDGTRTFYIFTNRSLQRLWLFADAGGPTDLNNPLVSFAALTPFSGGHRPALSLVPGAGPSPGPVPARSTSGSASTVALLFMLSNGQTRWLQYNLEAFNVEFNCLVGTQTPPPTVFMRPRGAKLAGNVAVTDIDGNGVSELMKMEPFLSPNCTKVPVPISVGPVGGENYDWTEFALLFHRVTEQFDFVAGVFTSVALSGVTVITPGPHAGAAGSFVGCSADNTETFQGGVSAGAEQGTTLRWYHWVAPRADIASGEAMSKSGMEDISRIVNFRCP